MKLPSHITKALLALVLCFSLNACMTTQSPNQYASSNQTIPGITSAAEILMPRTTRNLQRLADRMNGYAPRVSYQQEQRILIEKENRHRYWENQKRYSHNFPNYRNDREYQEYQDYLAWKNNRELRTQPTPTRNQSRQNETSQNDIRRMQEEYLSHEEFARIARRNGVHPQIIEDHRASQISLEKLPWESEPEYRQRLEAILKENQRRASRYQTLASQR